MIIRKIPWTSKPPRTVKVNRSSPLARDLFAFLYFSESGAGVYNAVTDRYFQDATDYITGSELSRAIDPEEGGVVVASSTDPHLQFTPEKSSFFNFSILARVKYDNDTKDHTLLHIGDALAGPGRILIWADTTASGLRPSIYMGTSGNIGSGGEIPANEWVTWGGNVTGTGSVPKLYAYVNGVYIGVSADAGSWAALEGESLRLFDEAATAREMLGKCSWVAIWKRVLTDAEHAAFYANPWQVLEPRTQRIPTYTAATNGLITRKIPWTSKPSLPRVDWSNPLTRGLKHLWVVINGAPYDLVSGAVSTNAGCTLGASGKYREKYYRTTAYGTQSIATNTVPNASVGSSGDKSAFSIINTGASGGETTRSAIGVGSTTTNAGWALLFMSSTHRVALAYRSVGTTFSTLTLSADTDYIIGFSHDSAASETTFFRDASYETVADTLNPLNAGTAVRLLGHDISGAITFSGGVGSAFYAGGVWDRKISTSEWASFWANPWQILEPRTQYIPVSAGAGAGAQSFTPDFLDDSTDTFYSPTVLATYSLTPDFLDDSTDTFYTPTVTATYSLSPDFLDDSTDTFYSPTITPGTVTLSPDFLDDSTDTFYTPTVTATYSLSPDFLDDSTDTFYSPTITPGTATIAPDLLVNTSQFFTPTITGGEAVVLKSQQKFIVNLGNLTSR